MSFDWKSALSKFAPWIAATLGGPAAGMAVEGLCKLAGLEPTQENAQKVAEMAAKGQLSGEQFIALQALEQEHQQKMQAMGYKQLVDLEQIAYQDRDSARQREIKTGDITPRILAYAVTLIWACVQGFLLWNAFAQHELPERMTFLIGRVLGTLDSALLMVFAYYYGTTMNSSKKDELLHQSTPVDKK